MERRGGDVHDELCAGEREVGRRRPGLPDVLADRRPRDHVAEAQQEQVGARGEVAVLVEDAVVGQEALAVDGPDRAVGEDVAGVVEVAVEVGSPDERDDARRLGGDRLDAPARRADERRAQQQVLGRVAGDRELGEEHEVGAGVACLAQVREDALRVAVEVADDGVDLCERESHLRFSPLDQKL